MRRAVLKLPFPRIQQLPLNPELPRQSALHLSPLQKYFKPAAEPDGPVRRALPDLIAEPIGNDGSFQRRLGQCLRERAGRRYGTSAICPPSAPGLSESDNREGGFLPECQHAVEPITMDDD